MVMEQCAIRRPGEPIYNVLCPFAEMEQWNNGTIDAVPPMDGRHFHAWLRLRARPSCTLYAHNTMLRPLCNIAPTMYHTRIWYTTLPIICHLAYEVGTRFTSPFAFQPQKGWKPKKELLNTIYTRTTAFARAGAKEATIARTYEQATVAGKNRWRGVCSIVPFTNLSMEQCKRPLQAASAGFVPLFHHHTHSLLTTYLFQFVPRCHCAVI